MTDQQLAIAQGFIQYVGPLVGSGPDSVINLNLVTHAIDLSTAKHPRYPADAVAECPELLLRVYKGDLRGRPNAGVTWDYFFSYWYYKQAPAGPDQQSSILTDLTAIENLFIGNFNPEPIKAAGCSFVMPVQTVLHDEMEHPLGEPRLRVGVGEILFGIKTETD